jgi:hypothetical protein
LPCANYLSAVMTVSRAQQGPSREGKNRRQSKGGGEIAALDRGPAIAARSAGALARTARADNSRSPSQGGGEDNSAADARALFEAYALASWARVQQKKLGAAGPITVARDLKLIASRSSTLLKLIKGADRNTFEAWAAVPYPEAVTLEMATQEWLQLKNLLDITVQRATQSARRVENTLKSAARPKRDKRGRPMDHLGDLLTIEAANIYKRRTGKSVVRNIDRDSGRPFGDFHNFLVRVFEVLEIKSSPDACNMRLQAELRGMKKK